MYIAFRDDDTSYFTKPEDIEKAYDFLEGDEPISLSVVPFTIPIHKDDVFPYGKNIEYGFYDVKDNRELCDYLKENVASGKIDVLLHGYSHEYKKIDNQWLAEMKWKSSQQLDEELRKGKEHIERIVDYSIKVFVAPNNVMDKKAISVIEDLKMDYSGIIMLKDRKITAKYIVNCLKRWLVRLLYKIPYPGILDYGTHKELVAYSLDNYERLVYEYEQCKKRNMPFVVYSHYWMVNRDERIKKMLEDIYSYAKKDGAKVISLTKCFEEK